MRLCRLGSVDEAWLPKVGDLMHGGHMNGYLNSIPTAPHCEKLFPLYRSIVFGDISGCLKVVRNRNRLCIFHAKRIKLIVCHGVTAVTYNHSLYPFHSFCVLALLQDS